MIKIFNLELMMIYTSSPNKLNQTCVHICSPHKINRLTILLPTNVSCFRKEIYEKELCNEGTITRRRLNGYECDHGNSYKVNNLSFQPIPNLKEYP